MQESTEIGCLSICPVTEPTGTASSVVRLQKSRASCDTEPEISKKWARSLPVVRTKVIVTTPGAVIEQLLSSTAIPFDVMAQSWNIPCIGLESISADGLNNLTKR